MVNGKPTCSPEDEEELRTDGSYPSGHTAIGWGWALILSELAPDRAEQILARGVAFGESRNVCNVHWRSDVQAGMLVGAAAYARLQNNSDFQQAMTLARQEIERARAEELAPERNCTDETSALKQR
jgi:acid phosphatase (class A)